MMYIVHVRVALATWTSQIDEPNADKPNADFYTQPTVCLERGVAPLCFSASLTNGEDEREDERHERRYFCRPVKLLKKQ